MQQQSNARGGAASQARHPSLASFLAARYTGSLKREHAVATKAAACAGSTSSDVAMGPVEPGETPTDRSTCPAFDPRGWAMHLKMLATPGMRARVALEEVKRELQAPARGRRATVACPGKVIAANHQGARA